jgi:hypothetical protein
VHVCDNFSGGRDCFFAHGWISLAIPMQGQLYSMISWTHIVESELMARFVVRRARWSFEC